MPYNFYDVSFKNLALDQLVIPQLTFSLFSSRVCLMLYQYCEEKLRVGHSWELKG